MRGEDFESGGKGEAATVAVAGGWRHLVVGEGNHMRRRGWEGRRDSLLRSLRDRADLPAYQLFSLVWRRDRGEGREERRREDLERGERFPYSISGLSQLSNSHRRGEVIGKVRTNP